MTHDIWPKIQPVDITEYLRHTGCTRRNGLCAVAPVVGWSNERWPERGCLNEKLEG